MMALPASNAKIAIVSLGYVGLPLTLSLARHFPAIGYDPNSRRSTAWRAGEDINGEFAPESLITRSLKFTESSNVTSLRDCLSIIQTVQVTLQYAAKSKRFSPDIFDLGPVITSIAVRALTRVGPRH
jgi:UDP-N-acetyl-D-mannosaminuronate dehydrogenase